MFLTLYSHLFRMAFVGRKRTPLRAFNQNAEITVYALDIKVVDLSDDLNQHNRLLTPALMIKSFTLLLERPQARFPPDPGSR